MSCQRPSSTPLVHGQGLGGPRVALLDSCTLREGQTYADKEGRTAWSSHCSSSLGAYGATWSISLQGSSERRNSSGLVCVARLAAKGGGTARLEADNDRHRREHSKRSQRAHSDEHGVIFGLWKGPRVSQRRRRCSPVNRYPVSSSQPEEVRETDRR